MFIPSRKYECELIVDRSRFIASLFPLSEIKQVDEYLATVKKEYPKARHYLYAYVVKNVAKGNDDAEPGNIAKGFISLLNQAKLDQVLVVVTRYFGGTKLGASRLLRTYLKVADMAIKNCEKKEIKKVYHYVLNVDYSTFNKLKQAGYHFTNVKYFATINLEIISSSSIDDALNSFGIKDFKRSERLEAI